MTVAQAKAHKEAIQFFIDNPVKGLWVRRTLIDKWEIVDSPDFYLEGVYIQNDDYSEFRKAIIDGKTIQLNNSDSIYDTSSISGWINITKIYDHIESSKYRIKPEKPQFSVGDWITHSTGNYQIKEMPDDDEIEITSTCNCSISLEEVTLWKPKHNNYYIFWENEAEYIIARFRRQTSYPTKYVPISVDLNGNEQFFRNIAPLEYATQLKGTE
jgi:hypothetical protein